MKFGAVTVRGLKTEDILENTPVMQLGGKAPEFRIDGQTRCADKNLSTIRRRPDCLQRLHSHLSCYKIS